ncbi:MAG: SRPBCC family protein [Bacteroides sp.]|nr:SRPBCC family protein [Bacteroides sp.]MCM1085886.1 SRPBCC family protein [Bacteroides sp.]
MKASSSTLQIAGPPETAYRKISNFSALAEMMPPQVQDFKATEDTCSFNVGGMAQINMRISQKVEPSLVVISSEDGSSFPFTLAFHFTPSEGGFGSVVEAEVNVNMIMAAMLKPQMQKFVDTLNRQIKTFCEAQPLG